MTGVPLREHLEKDGFRLRGIEVSRIDAFSDVVFGFALTLLVVSLQVPKTYAELHLMLGGFVPFAISFTLLTLIWFAHYKFFRRFGLRDTGTIAINAMLLFVVLYYVYPLKFLFTFVTAWMMGGSFHAYFTSDAEVRQLMVLYGVGFAGIYLLFAALYWNAWRQREALGLTALERVLVQGYVSDTLGNAGVGRLPACWPGCCRLRSRACPGGRTC